MKNIFKFMGIALMATSLLVACNKEKEEENNNNNNNNNQPTTVQKVNFNGTEWTAQDVFGTIYDSYGLAQWQIQQGPAATDAMATGNTGIAAGTYELGQSGLAEYYYFLYIENDDDYFEDEGQEYPRKQPYTCVSNVTALDANAQTVSMTVNAQVVDYPTYEETGELTPLPLTITLTNASWEEGE